MRHFNTSLTIMGRVVSIDPPSHSFQIQARSGDLFPTYVNLETQYTPISNLDGLSLDRFTNVPGVPPAGLTLPLRFRNTSRKTGAIAPVPRISTKSGPFSPGEWLESLPRSTRGY